jgi:hypothetical protein
MNNVVPPSLSPSYTSTYIAVIVATVVLMALLAYTDIVSRIRNFFLPILPLQPPTYKPDTYTEPPAKTLLPYDNTKNQTWCFIGEDNTGRYCVKVPRADLCDPIRTFGQRESCELIQGSQLPLGIVTESGNNKTPISRLIVNP